MSGLLLCSCLLAVLSEDSMLHCAVRKSQGITGAGKSSTANTMMKLRPENNSMHTSLSQARSMGGQLEASREGTKYTRELFQKKSQLDNGERRLNKNFPVSSVSQYMPLPISGLSSHGAASAASFQAYMYVSSHSLRRTCTGSD